MNSRGKSHLALLLAMQQCSGFGFTPSRTRSVPSVPRVSGGRLMDGNIHEGLSVSSKTTQHAKTTNNHLTCLFASDNDEEQKISNENNNNNDAYTNDLDIFGQPKEKQKKKSNSFFFNDDDDAEIQGPDRIKSCIPYALVLIDGDSFGKYIYERIPPLGTLDYVLLRPIVDGFRAAPLLSILLFTAFALGPQFTGQSRSVRFNAQQAILMDVALIFPTIIGESIEGENVARALVEPCTNFVWYAYVSMVIYCVVSNLRGKKPDGIPFLSQAAEMAIGPF